MAQCIDSSIHIDPPKENIKAGAATGPVIEIMEVERPVIIKSSFVGRE